MYRVFKYGNRAKLALGGNHPNQVDCPVRAVDMDFFVGRERILEESDGKIGELFAEDISSFRSGRDARAPGVDELSLAGLDGCRGLNSIESGCLESHELNRASARLVKVR